MIAENLGGSEDAFAKLMTQKAHALGMSHTTYVNASGLPDDDQITTARDQALLGRAIQDRFPRYYRFFSTTAFVFRGDTIRGHNHLLGAVDGVDGIKTGFTNASGFNLLTSVHRDGRYLVGVVLGGRSASERDAHMRALIAANIRLASARGAQHRSSPPRQSRKPIRNKPASPMSWQRNLPGKNAARSPRAPRSEADRKYQPACGGRLHRPDPAFGRQNHFLSHRDSALADDEIDAGAGADDRTGAVGRRRAVSAAADAAGGRTFTHNRCISGAGAGRCSTPAPVLTLTPAPQKADRAPVEAAKPKSAKPDATKTRARQISRYQPRRRSHSRARIADG